MVHRCLKNYEIFLLHTIGHSNPDMPGVEPFFHTFESYFLANNLVIKKTSFFKLSHNLTDIFPNGFIPYHQDITKYTEGLYTLEDWHNFGHCKNYLENSKYQLFYTQISTFLYANIILTLISIQTTIQPC